ncbi:hypothetical protein I6A84_29235 [Frankia sp. CNm7]|uniref:Uncharacterized protein n=1 Tax=Frankia nepalensis TaxID=1836974 RepID=A0A937R5T4_9ACTN|nr:SurA N-terminal domain-containing protein [Frankia nepalensis]MBL7498571.1 hypothetical protein [Frankia nepalensis]MBL7513772.1 hypothetical protein [Frankia nepalensis]MBL7522050.1 hypothetical protein [Frankia nepalensis]MBL7626268.1 hypothetical protein [Frankia nepalensis]
MKFPRLVIAALALLALAATACTSHAGAAAQVADTTIDTATVRGMVDRGMASYEAYAAKNPEAVAQQNPVTREDVQLRALNFLVQLKIEEAEARRLGVTLSPQELDAYYQAYAVFETGGVAALEEAAAAVGYAPKDLHDVVVRRFALDEKLADKTSPELVATDADIRSYYDSKLTELGVDSLPLSYEQARPFLSRHLMNDQRLAKLAPELVKAANREGVSVSPRFGVWSADDLVVLAADGSIATTPTPMPELNLS